MGSPRDLGVRHFSYRRQPLDILRSFLLYYLWSERCRRHFDGQYSLKRVLFQFWEATAEVGMATWKAMRSSSQDRTLDNQNNIELAFKIEWLHGHIFGEGEAAISWHLLPTLYFLNFSNDWWGCCLPPHKGFTLWLAMGATSKCHFIMGLLSWESRNFQN